MVRKLVESKTTYQRTISQSFTNEIIKFKMGETTYIIDVSPNKHIYRKSFYDKVIYLPKNKM